MTAVRFAFLSGLSRVIPGLAPGGWQFILIFALLVFGRLSFGAENAEGVFDAANKLYEQGRFSEAADAYAQLAQAGPASETLYFNLGNARFKAGQIGQAIAAWRQGERLAPRDPSLRFNLSFARKKVSGSDAPSGPAWQRTLQSLTLNEWTIAVAVSLWIWFLLLALREARPNFRTALKGYTATAGGIAVLLMACLASAYAAVNVTGAVVAVPEALARSGPLEEAKVLHRFQDGTELTVVDEKEFSLGDQKQTWLQVKDTANRTGWLKNDQVVLLKPVRLHPGKNAPQALLDVR